MWLKPLTTWNQRYKRLPCNPATLQHARPYGLRQQLICLGLEAVRGAQYQAGVNVKKTFTLRWSVVSRIPAMARDSLHAANSSKC